MHNELRDSKTRKPREFWSMLNPKKINSNHSLGQNAAYNHFKSISEIPNADNNSHNAPDIPNEGDEILNNDFTPIEIEKLINKLKNNKSCGIDNVINEFIKYSPDSYKSLLTDLFNTILKTGIIPSDWCISFISPIFKNKGSRKDPDNYRGISIISCLGKLFTALINERLTKFADINEIIGEEQAGFRSGYSTQDHIFTLHAIINIYLNKLNKKRNKRLYCAFIDYSKAFDLVDRTSLWTKLLACNITGKIMKLIYNLYQNTKACVKLNNKISQSFRCNVGVRQGDNLSPLLFALFINDFNEFLSLKYDGLSGLNNLFTELSRNDEILTYLRLYILLYADDTIIMAENPYQLQLALNALNEYCQTWKLTINLNKTKIIRFTKRRSPNFNYEFWLNGEKVELVENYVYLGTTISFNGKFKAAIEKQVTQANRALFSIKSKKDMYNLPTDIMLDLFDKMILPILLYGCEIWGFDTIDPIEIFFRKFLKYILKANRQTANGMVYGESGKLPLDIMIKTRMICFWHKTATGLNNKLSYRMLFLLKKVYEQNPLTSAWLKHIEETLVKCDMRNVWLNPKLFNQEWLKKSVTQKLSDKYKQIWRSDFDKHSSCIVYKSFKSGIMLEKYQTLLNNRDRINMFKFRCRNLKIPVVVRDAAERNIPYGERLCTKCTMNTIGDEYHYILECPLFQSHRQNYISDHYYINPNMEKFSSLFQTNNDDDIKKLAKLINEITRAFR